MLSSICGGTKLWVVVVDTTFNEVFATKLDEVTKLLAGGLEIVLTAVELLTHKKYYITLNIFKVI
jgi:hypothetical protein